MIERPKRNRQLFAELFAATEAWHEHANCRGTDPDLFFPVLGDATSQTSQAKKVCWACVVRRECLEYALRVNEAYGVWGGLTVRERRRLRVDGAA